MNLLANSIKYRFLGLILLFSLKAFSQLPTTDLSCWLRSDQGVTLNGTGVEAWQDQSGNNNHATQLNTAIQPVFVTNVLNAQPALRFNGSSILEGTTIPSISTSSMSVFVVASGGAMSSVYNVLLDIGPFGPGGMWICKSGSNTTIYCNNNVFSSGSSELSSSGFPPKIFEYSKDFSINSEIIINDVPVASSTAGAFVNSFTNGNYNVGGDPTYPNQWTGDIFEIIVYSRKITSVERAQVLQYIQAKYAPPVSLGNDTLTCNFPITLAPTTTLYNSYLWQDNSPLSSYTATAPGTYSIAAVNIFGITSKDTVVASFDTAPYTVVLGSDMDLCVGDSVLLNAGPERFDYAWSNGKTTNTIYAKAPGTYTVTVTDCLGGTSSDVIHINVKNISLFSFGADRPFCYNRDTVLTVAFANPTTYTWHDGSSNDSIKVDHSGVYSLTISDGTGCIYSDDITVEFDNSLSIVDLGPDLFLCQGNNINLIAGNNLVSSYTWSPTGDVTSYTTVNSSQYYYLDVVNTNLCTARDSVFVTITGLAPTADFSFSTTCFGTATQFTQLAVPPSGNSIVSYTWNFDDPLSGVNNTSNISDPVHSYTNSGNFNVELEVETDIGCKQKTIKQVTVYPLPIADFYNAPACTNGDTQFNDFTNSFSYPIIQWQWSFGDVASGSNNFATIAQPLHNYTVQNSYNVQLEVTTLQGCTDIVTKTIYVHPAPEIDFTYSTPCFGTPVLFTNTSVMPFPQTIQSLNWNFGDGGTSVAPSRLHTYTTIGTYTINLSIVSSVGCTRQTSKVINVTLNPAPNYSYKNFCLNQNTQLIDISTNSPANPIIEWQWEFNNEIFATNNTTEILFNSTGNKNVKLSVKTLNGCVGSVSKTILIKPLPVASFSYSPLFITPGETVTYSNLSQNATSYTWNLGNGFTSSQFKPVTIYPDTGKFVVDLTAVDENGCKTSFYKDIEVLLPNLDLGIASIIPVISADNFLELTVQLINYGIEPIHNFKLLSSVNAESAIREAWTGDLPRGKVLYYTFTSAIQLQEIDTVNAYVCVDITSVNDTIGDDNSSNNKLCVAFKQDKFMVLAGFPNPATDNFTIPVILPEQGEVETLIYNELGQEVFEKKIISGAKGLNIIEINTNYLAQGIYYYKISYQGKQSRNKFLKY